MKQKIVYLNSQPISKRGFASFADLQTDYCKARNIVPEMNEKVVAETVSRLKLAMFWVVNSTSDEMKEDCNRAKKLFFELPGNERTTLEPFMADMLKSSIKHLNDREKVVMKRIEEINTDGMAIIGFADGTTIDYNQKYNKALETISSIKEELNAFLAELRQKDTPAP